MRLESAINSETDLYYPFTISGSVVFEETLKAIMADMQHSDKSMIPVKFHNTVAQAILEVSEVDKKMKLLLKKLYFREVYFRINTCSKRQSDKLTKKMFKVYTNHQVPVNDGGISLGQLVVASKKSGLCA